MSLIDDSPRARASAAEKLDLGTHIGRPRWYAQLGALTALVGLTLSLGLTDPAPFEESQVPAPVAELSEADMITVAAQDLRPAFVPEIRTVEKSVKVGRGDTLGLILQRAGVSGQDAYDAVKALSALYNPRKLQVGQAIALTFRGEDESFESLRVKADVDRSVVVNRDETGAFAAVEDVIPLEKTQVRAGNIIDDSLFLAAERVGIPAAVIIEMIRMYSFEVDFQRELRAGDRFEVYYDEFEDESGAIKKTGDIQFAALTLSGKTLSLYRYEMANGDVDYFHEDGKSARRFLMKTPVDGARLSSSFGPRRHPVLGYNKVHKGTDFAAPSGTPIMAAGSGVVERADWYGSFGRYVRIRHNGSYQTAYAHMSGFGKGVKKGARVKQGQIIGYIGTTGRSTGPHLHYEVHYNGKQVNSQTLKVPTGKTLEGEERDRFMAMLEPLQQRIASTPMATKVASIDAQ